VGNHLIKYHIKVCCNSCGGDKILDVPLVYADVLCWVGPGAQYWLCYIGVFLVGVLMDLIGETRLEAFMLQRCFADIVGSYLDGQPVFVPLNTYVPSDYTLTGPCIGLLSFSGPVNLFIPVCTVRIYIFMLISWVVVLMVNLCTFYI
jgi:hypothetical protein